MAVDSTLQKQERNDLEVTRGSVERRVVKPRVDIYENEQELLLLADLPGIHPDNMDVRLENNALTLEARWVNTEHGTPEHREFYEVDYLRNFRLSQSIDQANIKAELNKGVLTLRLPKLARQEARQIPIQSQS
ncbi:MAG: Hsp20/alpha crystallin family protein [Myxococcota bacterium]